MLAEEDGTGLNGASLGTLTKRKTKKKYYTLFRGVRRYV